MHGAGCDPGRVAAAAGAILMHVKFLARGTGSCRKATAYLLAERDAAKTLRPEVTVLRGDPEDVAMVADTLTFKHRHTSGVIAWAPEDAPTDAQVEEVLDEFEHLAWASLEPDRYCWTAVLHREEGGGCHVHVLTARVDLDTGKSLNIAPPGWQRTFDPLRDLFNCRYGWAQPDDPARRRLLSPGPEILKRKHRLRAALQVEPSPKEVIAEYLMVLIEDGQISDRPEALEVLKEAGLEIPRAGRNYITVLDPDTGKRHRLRGQIFERDFNAADFSRPAPGPERGTPSAAGQDNRDRVPELQRQLEAAYERRARFHVERYGQSATTSLDGSAADWAEPDYRPGGRELVRPELSGSPDPGPDDGTAEPECTAGRVGRPRHQDPAEQSFRDLHRAAVRLDGRADPFPERAGGHGHDERVNDGRNPNPFAAFIERIIAAVRRGAEAARRSFDCLVTASEESSRARQSVERKAQYLGQESENSEHTVAELGNRHGQIGQEATVLEQRLAAVAEMKAQQDTEPELYPDPWDDPWAPPRPGF